MKARSNTLHSSLCAMASKEHEEIREMVQKMWGYLDNLAESDPKEYQKFIGKA